jgi:hypothetical protein
MKNYMKVLTNEVRNHPHTFIKFRIGDKIGVNGRKEIAAAIQASNDANHRADQLLERKVVGDKTIYVNYEYRN